MQLELQVQKVSAVILVHLEVMDSLAIQDHRETLASLGRKEGRVPLETPESMDRQACSDPQALVVGLVILVSLDVRDRLVSQAYKVQLVAEATLACRVKRVLLETLEQLDRLDKQACKVILVCLGHRVNQGHQASLDKMVHQAALVSREPVEHQGLRVMLERPDQLVILGVQVFQVNQVHQVKWVRLGNEALPECEDPLDDEDSLVSKAIPVKLVILALQDFKVLWDSLDLQDLLEVVVRAIFIKLFPFSSKLCAIIFVGLCKCSCQ